MKDPLADFTPDDELRTALDMLIASRRVAGTPHPEPLPVPMPWPTEGIGGSAALQAFAPLAFHGATRLDHPGFLAHMDPPTPWFTWAATQWAAAANQNLLHPDVAPQMRLVEDAVVRSIAPVFGMSGGHLLPGSTVANLTALWAARDLHDVTEVVSSDAAHLSVAKAAHILGLPHRPIPTLADQSIDAEALGELGSAAIVLTAGSAGAGAIDDLGLAEHTPRAAWVHVDAAWAGPLRFSPTHASTLDGIEHADSIGFSAHKWLHQPKESAAILFADADRAHAALSFGGGYLSAPNVGLLGSAAARALPLAITLLAWGQRGVAAVIDAGMERISELHRLVEADAAFEVFTEPRCGVLLWRPTDGSADLVRVQAHLVDAWVSVAEVDGQQWLRSVGANPFADPVRVIEAVTDALHAVRSGQVPGTSLSP